MKYLLKFIALSLAVFTLFSCSSDDTESIKDEEKPTITINENSFPQPCDTLKRGQSYHFKAFATDNVALASYSINIHNNFDHHAHDDQGVPCEQEADKVPVTPFSYIENFEITGTQTSFEIDILVTIPNDADTGDYHCTFLVVNKEAWSSSTSVGFKIAK